MSENVRGGEAIAERLDEMAGAGGAKGFHARVSFLTRSEAGQRAMMNAGIDLHRKSTRRTVLGWLSDPDATPTPKYRRAVDSAYAARRRQTMASSLKSQLRNGGRGTRVEVYPPNQSQVAQNKRRNLDVRRVNIRPSQWDTLVGAWARGDVAGMNAAWMAMAADVIGSDWGAYTFVEAIGF